MDACDNEGCLEWLFGNGCTGAGEGTSDSLRTIELRVLGFPDSGKTQFLNALRRVPNPQQNKIETNGVLPIPPFVFELAEGKNQHEQDSAFRIKTIDINGSKEYLMANTGNFAEQADYLLFMCDIVTYLTNKNDGRKDVHQVLRAIQVCSQHNSSSKVHIILTHEDLLSTINKTITQAIVEFKSTIKFAPYGEYPCHAVNTCDQDAVRKLFKEIIQNGE